MNPYFSFVFNQSGLAFRLMTAAFLVFTFPTLFVTANEPGAFIETLSQNLSNPPQIPQTEAETEGETEAEAEPEALSLDTIQDFWKLYDVSESFRERYLDGESWQTDDENLFLFYNLQERIRPARLESWALPNTALVELDALAKPELNARRFDAFWIHGRLLSFTETKLESDIAFRYRIDSFYTCQLELDDGRHVTLFCRYIPRALRKPGALDAQPRVGLIALFLKKGPAQERVPGKDGQELEPLFMLGQRLGWFPDTILGNAGMDYGLFDDLDREELPPEATRSVTVDTRLSLRNRECFYQQMAAVRRISPARMDQILADVQKNAPDEYFEQIEIPEQETKENQKRVRYSSVAPLFNRPAKERGNFFFLKGIARRIVPIRVEDEDINERFGIDHYYEIFIFPDEAPESPVVILVPELPPDVQPGNDMGYYVELTIPCFFFNTWSYDKGKNEDGKQIRHLAPLLLGGIPSQTVSDVYTPDLTWFCVLVSFVFGTLFVVSTALYIGSCRENQECAKNRQKMYSLPEGTHFEDEMENIPKSPEVGFSEWAQQNETPSNDEHPVS